MVQHSTKTLKKTREKALPYAEDFAAQLLAFFDVPPFKVTEVLKKDGSVSLVETACELPTFEAFAKVLGTTKATLVKWENAHPAFAEAAAKARDLQSNILIQNSLRGNYSSSFAVLTAKNLLGWKDGKDDAHCVQKPLVVRWGNRARKNKKCRSNGGHSLSAALPANAHPPAVGNAPLLRAGHAPSNGQNRLRGQPFVKKRAYQHPPGAALFLCGAATQTG